MDPQLYLTYDDLLLLPRYSEFMPDQVDLSTHLTASYKLQIPLLAAPMDTVCEGPLALALFQLGGMGFIHRNLSIDQQRSHYRLVRSAGGEAGIALGVGLDLVGRAQALIEEGATLFCLDAAHGHSKKVIEATRWLRSLSDELQLIAGNVATYEGAKALYEAGADAVRVGVGPGSICSTRIVCGVGVPQWSALLEVKKAAREFGKPFIADGGVRTSGDLVKALAAGASCVMVGSLLAGTDEAPGERVEREGEPYKRYRGMGSTGAMRQGSAERYGISLDEAKKVASQGVEGLVPCRGSLREQVELLLSGLRSGMGYIGAGTIEQMERQASFLRVTMAGLAESHPHSIVL